MTSPSLLWAKAKATESSADSAMAFTPIDEQTWERREYLEVFRQTAIYLTAEVDITPLYRHTKARGEKLYPALVWCVAAVLNRHAHFRYGRDEAGRIGIWDELHPYYTVPRRDAPDLFAMKVTRFTPDYDAFLSQFREDCARAETCGRLLCDETLPPKDRMIKKTEKNGLYEALNIASIWLERSLNPSA